MKLKIEFHGFSNLVIWLWKNVGKALETFLKDSVRTLISVTLSFTLTVTPFSLKVQVGVLRYLVPTNSVVQNCTKRTLEL